MSVLLSQYASVVSLPHCSTNLDRWPITTDLEASETN